MWGWKLAGYRVALVGDLPNDAPSASVTLRPNGGNGTCGFSVVYPQDPEE